MMTLYISCMSWLYVQHRSFSMTWPMPNYPAVSNMAGWKIHDQNWRFIEAGNIIELILSDFTASHVWWPDIHIFTLTGRWKLSEFNTSNGRANVCKLLWNCPVACTWRSWSSSFSQSSAAARRAAVTQNDRKRFMAISQRGSATMEEFSSVGLEPKKSE